MDTGMFENCNPLSNQDTVGVIGHVPQSVLVALSQTPHNTEVAPLMSIGACMRTVRLAIALIYHVHL